MAGGGDTQARTRRFAADFCSNRAGSIATYFALAVVPIMMSVGVAVDYAGGLNQRNELQALLDAAALAGASDVHDPAQAAETYFYQSIGLDLPGEGTGGDGPRASFTLDGDTLSGIAAWRRTPLFGMTAGAQRISVSAEVTLLASAAPSPCVTVLANSPQALLLNSGASMDASACEVHVHSTQDPAFIMNAGVDLDIARLCVKGTKYIRNGGSVTSLETGCAAVPDAYAGTIPEPSVPTNCTTSGARDGQNHSLNPGAHCWVNFNGNPTITFKPGLHIIKGSMNINNRSTVIADGVTFYFPDTDSQIQANGALTMRATAPTSGAYKDILMFEKTSDAANNVNKRNYVFNGSVGEQLEGLIYLPNRNVTYNSTTNVSANRMSLVVNTLIVNSANWAFEGLGSGAGSVSGFYLSR
jgi:hypothetical protein